MTDLTPEIEPAARQFAEDMTLANRMPFAALVMRHARAMSLIRHLMRSRRKWQDATEFYRRTAEMLNQAQFVANSRAGDLEAELSATRGHAAWFAAEAAYWKTEAGLYHTVAAQNYENDGITVASLDAERTELQARIAFLEDQCRQWDAAFQRQKAAHRERRAELRARIWELESPPANPDAYIAVKRYFAVSADGPEWCDDAAVISASHIHAWEREDHQKRGYQLLPIVADGDGTRFAATPPTRCQATTASPLIDDRRSLWCELPAGHAGMHHAAVPQLGFPATEVDWDDSEEAER